MDFKSFKLVQTDMTAQRRVYEGYKTENGVHLEYYISTEMWDDMLVLAIVGSAVATVSAEGPAKPVIEGEMPDC